MRTDARRNRERITTAAARLLTEYGADVPMARIAEEAQVAVGTIYRHFPDRAGLLLAIAHDAMEELLRHAEATAGMPARAALDHFVERAMTLPLALIKSLPDAPVLDTELLRMQREIDDFLGRLVTAAQRDATVRRDISADAIVELVSTVVCRPGAHFGDPMTVVMLDGLNPR
ncbi:TetR/AcrR family transcriptional regulator [Yinghuangia sp. ASG 101]|uniref:TetR/AcrR family transcriptional regulator n=1 Tax=Yinghuangia sp. ASG 101 TaxID=2896848 RepID=UPI001E35EC42|nr:helix-turn-helix domain-containing protein [Yinghuangia sp. ASG 101]UGQ13524.1 TetR/AcrR family transcriptional regulator [Yinghuangia sp. ASG 101]